MSVQTPGPIDEWNARPWCRTFHGLFPRPERSVSALLTP